MPEDVKTDQATQTDADKALIDRITAGVTAGVSAAMPTITEKIASVSAPAAPVRTEPVTTLVRPTEEDVIEAVANGDKALAAKLMKQQRAYDAQENQRALGNITAQGGAAIGSIAKTAAASLPMYKRYKKEIDDMVDGYVAANPGVIPTYDMYERAHSIVKGNHADELIAEAKEEAIRAAREPAPDLTPDGGRRAESHEEPEPKSLSEALAGDWKSEFRTKQRGVGGRTDDEELRKAGFKGFDDFITQRKNNQRLEEESQGTMYLDRDWACKAHGRKFCAGCSRANAEGEWV